MTLTADVIILSVIQLIYCIMMGSRIFLILLLGVTGVLSINKTCNLIDPCPMNAYCNSSSNYCICKPGFIGNCLTPAMPLTNDPQILELRPQDSRLLYMTPIEADQQIYFTIRLCRRNNQEQIPAQEQGWVMLYMWEEKPKFEDYFHNNTIISPSNFSFQERCHTLDKKYLSFPSQPNGLSAMLVIGLQNGPFSLTLLMTAEQKLLLGVTFYYYIMIGTVISVSILVLTSTIVIVLKRRQSIFSAAYAVDLTCNLDHFDLHMPSLPANTADYEPCPICLQSIQVKEEIRRTPCEHIFHTNCLDCWCIHNLNCPVCRSDFSAQKIGQIKIKDKQRRASKNRRDGYEEGWEENSGQEQRPSVVQNIQKKETMENERVEGQIINGGQEGNRQIRQPML